MALYDGSTRWRDFSAQFLRMRRMAQWPKYEDTDRLALALTGPALQYFESLQPQVTEDLVSAMQALEKRFGRTLSTAGHRLRFQNLNQNDQESLLQFADRIRSEATDAFPNMDPVFTEETMAHQFLLGCQAKDAALCSFQKDCSTLDDAVDLVSRYVESQRMILRARPKNPTLSPARAMIAEHVSQRPNHETRGQRGAASPSSLERVQQDVRQLQTTQTKLVDSLNQLGEQVSTLVKRFEAMERSRRGSRSPSPRSGTCYHCQEPGHFARDCPKKEKPRSPSPANRRVSFAEELNDNGGV